MKKILMIWTALFLTGLGISAQEANKSKNETGTGSKPGRVSIGIGAGTFGYGGSLAIRLTNRLSVSAGYYTFSGKFKTQADFDGNSVNLDFTAKLNGIPVLLEVFPFKKSSFHFKAGVVINNNSISAIASPKDSQSYGSMVFAPVELGELKFKFVTPQVMPYLGIGFGRSVPKHRLGFGVDMGACYQGSPGISIDATEVYKPANTPENEAILKKAFSDYKFYPFINFKINLKLF